MAHLDELACRYPFQFEHLPLLRSGGYERAYEQQ